MTNFPRQPRPLEDEECCDFSPPHLPCAHCGNEDCEGSDPRDLYPPCVPVCSCCGRLPDDCPGNVATFYAEHYGEGKP